MLIAHRAPTGPSDLWHAWPLAPFTWFALLGALAVYLSAPIPHTSRARRRKRLFVGGMVVLTVALVTPLDPLGHALASAHMMQHLLLIVVAAPLVAASDPGLVLLRGLPRSVQRPLGRLRRMIRRHTASPVHMLVAASSLHAATLWIWHIAGPYDLAVGNAFWHAVEHAALFGTAVVAWTAILRTLERSDAVHGVALLCLFGLTMTSVVLGLLLAFATEPWYDSYQTTEAWGLSRLVDQQLAGVLMWVPGGVTYLAVALAILVRWIGTDTPSELAEVR